MEAAASAPAEAGTPTEAAASTPAEGGTPDKAAAGYTDTTPAEQPAADGTKVKVPPGEGKATTPEQKFIEKVNQAFKKALDAANAAAPDDKFSVFDAAFNREIKQCLAGMSAKFISMIDRAFKIAYNSAVAATNAQEKFSCLVLTLTEALRFIAATLDAHAIKPAIEEVVAGGMKAADGATRVIKKLDTVIKAASAAAKEAPKADRIPVFQAALNKAIKEQMGPGYDGSKTTSDLDAAFKKAVESAATSKPEAKDTDVADALAKSITTIANATKDGAETAAAPATEAGTKTAAADAGYKAADKSAAEPAAAPAAEAADKSAAEPAAAPAAEAATAPAAEAATKPTADESGYKAKAKAKAEAAPKPAAESATKSAAKLAADAPAEPAAEAATKPADGKSGYKAAADAATKPAAAGGYNL
nr:pollen allergen Phl p 5b-like [Aegilops tauschii subsp. strangulata]